RLQVDQARADGDEVGERVQVELLGLVQVLQVLVSDGHQRDGGDVQLLALDEVEEQVERALEDGQAELIGLGPGRDAHRAMIAGCGRRVCDSALVRTSPASAATAAQKDGAGSWTL